MNAYVYDGTGRDNATAFIENNQTAVLGAPFKAPISATLIVVLETAAGGRDLGEGAFSYQVFDEEEYAWWFQFFVGKEEWKWYATFGSVAVFPFLLLTICVCCCKYSTCCQRNCPCCISPCCARWPAKEDELPDKKMHINKVSMHPDDMRPSHGNLESEGPGQVRLSVEKMSENGLEDFSDANNNLSDAGTVPTVGGHAMIAASQSMGNKRSP